MEHFPLSCVICGGELDLSPDDYAACTSCGRMYPKTLGIIDLRKEILPRKHREDEVLQQMITKYPICSLNDLIQISLSAYDVSQVRVNDYLEYFHFQEVRGTNMLHMFQTRMLEIFGPLKNNDISLDIGCGAGSSLSYLSTHFHEVIGVDSNIIHLILAKKYCEERGFKNVFLVQALADCLPFPDQTFDFISGVNVLEHIFKLFEVTQEAHRTAKEDGMFVADSRNRFDPFFPEPHVSLRWVGFLPRPLAIKYIKLRTNEDYDDVHLLSYWDLQGSFNKIYKKNFVITFPRVSPYGHSEKLDRIVYIIEKIPLVNKILLMFFPSHLVIAQRKA